MEKIKSIFFGVLIGVFVCGISFGAYKVVLMYKAIAYVQADIRAIDSFLKYQVDNGVLTLPKQTETTPAQ